MLPQGFAWASLAVTAALAIIAPGEGMATAREKTAICPPAHATSATPTVPSSAGSGTPSAEISEARVHFGETDALFRRAGEQGAVLSHGAIYDAASWRPQAEAMAEAGTSVLALEQTTPESILAGAQFLNEVCGVTSITLIGASAGASTALDAASRQPAAFAQIIILSGTGDVSGLGEGPKLFVASEDEGLADTARQMAMDAPGTANESLILPGSAHAQAIFTSAQGDELLQAILARLRPA